MDKHGSHSDRPFHAITTISSSKKKHTTAFPRIYPKNTHNYANLYIDYCWYVLNENQYIHLYNSK